MSSLRLPRTASGERLDEISQVWLVWGKAVALPRYHVDITSVSAFSEPQNRHPETPLYQICTADSCAVASDVGIMLFLRT
jgi:hypothetical protein